MENKRLGGWLILLGFQLIGTVFISMYSLNQYFKFILSSDWKTYRQLDLMDGFVWLSYYEIFMYSIILLISPIIITKYLNKSVNFKKYYSTFIVGSVVLYVIDYIIAYETKSTSDLKINQIIHSIFSYIIWGAVWINYLYKGKRPMMTFVN